MRRELVNCLIVFSSFCLFFIMSSPGECVLVVTLDSHLGPAGEHSSGVRESPVPRIQPHGPRGFSGPYPSPSKGDQPNQGKGQVRGWLEWGWASSGEAAVVRGHGVFSELMECSKTDGGDGCPSRRIFTHNWRGMLGSTCGHRPHPETFPNPPKALT